MPSNPQRKPIGLEAATLQKLRMFTKTPAQHAYEIFHTFYTPSQAERIQPLVRATPDLELETGKDWDNINWLQQGVKRPPRLAVIAGIGSIHYLEKICNDPLINQETQQIIVVENDPKVVTHLIHHPKFLKYLSSPHIKFIFLFEGEQFKAALFNLLKQPALSRIMQDGGVYFNNNEPDEERKKFYSTLDPLFAETIFHVYHNYGQIHDSIEGVSATFGNHLFTLENPGIQSLKGVAKGRACLIVGAGPGLDKEIETIKANREKFLIIAADAAVKPLLKAGIEPELTTSIERGNIYQKPFWEGLPKINTQLVCYPVVHPEVISIYPGPKRCVYRNYSYYAYFEKSWPRTMLASGGSTSHLAFRLASWMQADPIIFVGVDSAYEETSPGLYRSHAHGLGYEQWAESHPIEYFSKENKHTPALDAEAFDGSIVKSNITYHQWAKEFVEDLMIYGLEDKVYHVNPKAVKIHGMVLASLSGLSASIEAPTEPLDLFKKGPHRDCRPWTHDTLRRNLVGWHRLAKLLESLTRKAIDEKIAYPEFLAHSYHLHNQKFLEDDMFVSFVVQNCAAEFYKLQNHWYSYSLKVDEDLLEKVGVLRAHFELYEYVIRCLFEKLGWELSDA